MTVESRSACPRCGASLGPDAFFCPRCGTSISVAPADSVATAPEGAPRGPNALLDALRHAALGEYEILAELGRGGMATVYLAHDLALDRKVAIKVLAPALLLMGEGMVERFKREARTAAALSHPHIIPIYAVKESGQVLYFVMKYVQGRPLDSIIRDVGQLPIQMVQAILAHVGDALGYAHRHGVIHRDIKSANIMLDEEGWAVVTDFGIAKVVQAEGLTVTGVTVGTPSYMSPEQCATREVTGASDQYSLGIVAYEMLTGHLPFRGDSTMSVMYAHFNQRPRPVTELRPDVPPNLAAAVMRMLEKDPLGRWPSMDDVVAVCGRPSLRHDDPIRSQMITLARAGGHVRQLAQLKTPTSPIAFSRSQPSPVTSRPRRRLRAWWGVGVVAVAVALWWTAPWRMLRQVTAPAPDTVMAPRLAPAGPAADTVPIRRPPEATPPVGRGTRSPARRGPGPRAAPGVSPSSAAAAESVARATRERREDSLVLSLRTTAVAAMRRALEAGATPAELANGDTVFRGAESLAATGRLPEAIVQLATATSLWREAERLSRARVAQDSARVRAAEPAAPPAAVRPPADPRVQIEQVIADYARALESLDLGQVRRAYPGLTPAQQQGWRDFFPSVRRLRANLTVTAVNLVGGTAEAIVTGFYEYESTTTSRAERRPATFRAILVADSTGWRLTTIR